MEVIKFDLDKLKKEQTGFTYYILGRSYDLEENGATQDYEIALYYYKKGAELGYPLCIYSLGISYELGLGDVLEVDKVKAKELLTKAYPLILDLINNSNISETERLYVKFVTGAYHYYGLGEVKKNNEVAFNIIKECALKGHIAAIYDLGANFYYNGNGVEQNLELAEYYLNIASNNDLPRAKALVEARKHKK